MRQRGDGTRTLQLEPLEARRVLAQLLPDLFAWENASRGYLHDYEVQGNLLRFTTALGNMGEGHLEIRGGAVTGPNTQEVFQRIFSDDGSFEDVLAGEFLYHSGHGHIHFDGYAIYNLRERLPDDSVGDVLATGGKVSFCLIDITKYDPSAGSSQYSGCGATRQGITAGWADVYSRFLSDQWINITGIDDGDYYLEVVVDPDDQLQESDETNNSTVIPITITDGPGNQGDRYEGNNTFATATEFGPTSHRDEGGLSLHTETDTDFFTFTAVEDGQFEAETVFTHSLGDLSMNVYDGAQNPIGSSNGTTDSELVSWPVLAGERFYVEVSGDVNGYELYLDGPGDLSSVIVASEDPAANIPDGEGTGVPGPSITSTLEGPDVILSDVNLIIDSLTHTWVGDLHMEITSPQGTTAVMLRSSAETPAGPLGGQDDFQGTIMDDEATLNIDDASAPFSGRIDMSHSSVGQNPLSVFIGENAAGTWTLEVTDYWNSDTGSLNAWSIEFTGNLGDRYEPNEAFPQAVDWGNLGITPQVEDNLSIHQAQDVDFFRFNAAQTGLAAMDLAFDHAGGNLQLNVYDENLALVGSSDSLTSNEHFSFPVVDTDLYYVSVSGSGGDTNSDYMLTGVVSLLGDVNLDNVLDVDDVDALCGAMSATEASAIYDLNSDGVINSADMDVLIQDVFDTDYGDANLDGAIDATDFAVWNANKFTAGGWGQGDFTCDGMVDGFDFLMWNQNKDTVGSTVATEPAAEMDRQRHIEDPSADDSRTKNIAPVTKYLRSSFTDDSVAAEREADKEAADTVFKLDWA